MEGAKRNEGNLQAQVLRRADRVLVGAAVGGNSLPLELAFAASRARGSRIWDVEGQEYIDFVSGSGSLILGHIHPAVIKAVMEQLELGTQYFLLHEPALKLAEEIVRAVPGAEKVRFAMSGSEATFYALRLARAYTGRDKILKFEGAYHGHQDYTMMSVTPTDPPDFPMAVPDTAGIPKSLVGEVLVAPFNDIETTTAIIKRHARDLAAVLVEPVQRCIRPVPGFLEALRTVTRELSIVLIYDEVVTGFRLAYGGAQEFYGVTADLVTFGKIIGGGFPLAAVVGKADIMDMCHYRRKGSPEYVYFSGTLNGNPVSTTAGLATLAELRKPGTYERLHEIGRRMREGLAAVVAERGIPAQSLGEGPVCHIEFTGQPIRNYRDVLTADRKLWKRIGEEMLRRGIYVKPGGEKLYLNLAHSNEDIDRYVALMGEILDDLKVGSAARR